MSPRGMGYFDEGCLECDFPAGGLTIGDGKCNNCHGTGLDSFTKCERCHSAEGVCPRCNGWGYHRGEGHPPYPPEGEDDESEEEAAEEGGGSIYVPEPSPVPRGTTATPSAQGSGGCIGIGIVAFLALIFLMKRDKPAPTEVSGAVTGSQTIEGTGLPLCGDARVIRMSIAGPTEDYLALHEKCWSGSVQFVEGSLPNDYSTISHVGDDRGFWFQFLFADGSVSPIIRTGDPTTDGVYRPRFIGSKFQIRGTGKVKIIYELQMGSPARTPSLTAGDITSGEDPDYSTENPQPDGELKFSRENVVESGTALSLPEAQIPRSEAPLGEAGNLPEAEEIIFVGEVLSSESEAGRVLVLVRTSDGRYAAVADTNSWADTAGRSDVVPWDLEGKTVRVTGRECRGRLICITKIEILDN